MFKLNANFKITAEQGRVVETIAANYKKNIHRQVLLGVTGSGKTFTMKNFACPIIYHYLPLFYKWDGIVVIKKNHGYLLK